MRDHVQENPQLYRRKDHRKGGLVELEMEEALAAKRRADELSHQDAMYARKIQYELQLQQIRSASSSSDVSPCFLIVIVVCCESLFSASRPQRRGG